MKPIPYTCPCCSEDGELCLKWYQALQNKISLPCKACKALLISQIKLPRWKIWILAVLYILLGLYLFLFDGSLPIQIFYPILVAIGIVWISAENFVGCKRTVSIAPGDLNLFDKGKLDDTDL